jgi:hypothetical protein
MYSFGSGNSLEETCFVRQSLMDMQFRIEAMPVKKLVF